MTSIRMSSSRGTNTFSSVPMGPIWIGTKNRKLRTIISKTPNSLRIMTSRGTKIIQIEKTPKNILSKKTMFIVGNRGTKSNIIPITN